MRSSYGLRLIAAFAGVGVASAAITAILVNLTFGSLFNSYVSEQQSTRGAQSAAVMADSYRQHQGWDRSALQNLGPTLLMDGGELRVTDANGVVVLQLSEDPSLETVRLHRELMGSGPLGPERSIPILVDGTQVGSVAIRLPAPGLQPHDLDFRHSVNQMLLVGGLVAGMVALALGIVLSRRASIPVRELTAAANAWERGERQRRVQYSSDDEFGTMTASFNAMADSIEEQERLRRAFAADVAHELRTPLMVLRSQLEAMQDGVMKRDDSTLGSLHEEVLRLSRLVADLEVLASAGAAKFGLEKRLIDLREQVAGSVEEFRALFPDRTIGTDLPKSRVMVEADPGRIRQMLSNLFSNALKFTPEGGLVRVALIRAEPDAILEVSDSGPGIPKEELDSVFDRFFRGRRAKAAGSGIGLTVVMELVSAHGGRVTVASPEAGGAVFRVELPLAATGPNLQSHAAMASEGRVYAK